MGAPRTLSTSVTVTATPLAAYETVADLTRMGEWSPECRRVRWRSKPEGAREGAKFRGYNKNGWHRWSTTGRIVDVEPGRRLAWKVSFLGLPLALWSYDFEQTSDGCRITESWVDRQLFLTRPAVVGWLVSGVWARADRNAETMEATLARVKASIESSRTVRAN